MIDEIVREFIVESLEMLDQLDQAFVALERSPDDTDAVSRIFRAVHTVKGTGGCLGFVEVERVAHAAEALLARVRDGELRVTGDRISVLLAAVDAIRAQLGAIERTGAEDGVDHAELIDRLGCAMRADAAAASPRTAGAAAPPRAPAAAEPSRLAESSVRVDVGLLDKVMNLVGELVLARNRLLQCAGAGVDPALSTTSQRINLITSELQEQVMKTRMQPIGSSWGKLPRLVRETALACDKSVVLTMEGHHTELDRTLLEAVRDPLTHLVRNAVDHGIEAPAARRAAGKPVEGRLVVRAHHSGGQVYVEVPDDGAGLPLDRIRAKAVERGLHTAAEVAHLADAAVADLIFHPGFSTAETVTAVSGRGVGMDVVRSAVEAVGGTVTIESRPGRGTTIRIALPLTLAILPALVVRAGGQRFVVPQASLLELMRLDEARQRQVVRIDGAPMFRLRGELVPMVHLAGELGLPPRAEAGVELLVVVQAEGRRMGLVVDSVSDTAEIVVKPLSTLLRGATVYAGATVMGDGGIALIVDVPGLARRAGVLGGVAAPPPEAARPPADAVPNVRLLLVRDAADRPYAVPLASVTRLEEFAPERLQHAGGLPAVAYQGEILPLYALGALCGGPSGLRRTGPVRVVVLRVGGHAVGVEIAHIDDIVEVPLRLDRRNARPGLCGSALLGGKVTDVLDLPALVSAQVPGLLTDRAA